MLPLRAHRPPLTHNASRPLRLPSPPPARLMDSTAADFRAFYPYTPNEVKHRKRTTNAQLKTLESVFKRDTKPNGPLRVELAAKLGMTARGVQVWFQNRRAKEKLKAAKSKKLDIQQREEGPQPNERETSSASPTGAKAATTPRSDACDQSQVPSPTAPPRDSQLSWDTLVEPQSLLPSNPNHVHAHRRGSLPVNALPHHDFPTNPPEAFDPLARRFSVDANVQRLASNPYAHLARAKNTALFGPRAAVPIRRPLSRGNTQKIGSMPYPLDIRRASASALGTSPRNAFSPSPSPLSHYIGARASLPDTQLYSTRNLSPPIPGPLPSPNFSFGAASSTPSMVSTSSGSSERNSPDSLRALPYQEPEQDDEDGNTASASYFPPSRFSSIASIATSESSVNSSYFPDSATYYADTPYNSSLRRDSCVSGSFSTMMSTLNVSGVQLQESMRRPGVTLPISSQRTGEQLTLNADTSPVPISKSSELAYALQSQQMNITTPDQVSPTSQPAVVESCVEQYSYPQAINQQMASNQSDAYEAKCHYSYDSPTSYFSENYSVSGTGTGQPFHPLNFQYQPAMGPLETVPHSVYAGYS